MRAEFSESPSTLAADFMPLQDNEADMGQHISAHCRLYQGGDIRRSIFQLTTTLGLFIGLMTVMFTLYQQGWFWACAALWLPAGGLLVRLFIIQHDCGHGSYFNGRRLNDAVGRALSLLTVTPYSFWRDAHNVHHAGSGNLARRGIGGIDTLTVREYQALPKQRQWTYRLYRHPLMVLLIGPPLYVLLIQRLPLSASFSWFEDYRSLPYGKTWRSVLALDAALILFYGAVGATLGFLPLLAVLLPPTMIAAWAGGWLFFVQHQFEETYWKSGADWNFRDAALQGSSHYVLPGILKWFTGNIGLHHIHHLCSAIPNYRLTECLGGNTALADMNRMSIRQSLRSIPLALWDEERKKMVSFSQAKRK